jgi:hypothetical protein
MCLQARQKDKNNPINSKKRKKKLLFFLKKKDKDFLFLFF